MPNDLALSFSDMADPIDEPSPSPSLNFFSAIKDKRPFFLTCEAFL